MTEPRAPQALASEDRFKVYLGCLTKVLGHASQVSAAWAYCAGLLPPGERKSISRWQQGWRQSKCGQRTSRCTIPVSLSMTNDQASLPAAYQLYPPQAWAEDPARRAKSGAKRSSGKRNHSGPTTVQ